MTDEQGTPNDPYAEALFRLQVQRGLSDITAGRVVADDEARVRLAKWLGAPHDERPRPVRTGGQG